MLSRRPNLVAERGANMLEYVGITIVVAGVIVALAMTTVPSDIQAGFANGVCRIVNPSDPDCRDGGATASPGPGENQSPQPSGDPSGDPTGAPTDAGTTGPGGSSDTQDYYTALEEQEKAAAAQKDAEDEWGNLDEELLDLVAELVGWNSAKDCFTKGDIGACLETLLTAIPWGKLFKAAKLIPKIWKLFRRWQKLYEKVSNARKAKKAADSKLDDALAKACKITPGKPGNSFLPGTRVLLADGRQRPIEAIRVGDRVLAADPASGVTAARTVTDLIAGTGAKRLVDVAVDLDGRHGGRSATITATDTHSFWADGRWTEARNLTRGATVRTAGGGLRTITAVRDRTASGPVHNLTVEGLHSYFVVAGAGTSVLVHNDFNIAPGYTGRVDRFNFKGQAYFEVHVYQNGREVGIYGSNGWIGKHGHSANMRLPDVVENRMKGVAIDEMRRAGRLPDDADIKGDNWKRPHVDTPDC